MLVGMPFPPSGLPMSRDLGGVGPADQADPPDPAGQPETVVAPPPARRKVRAGRNLPAAIGVGASLGVIIIGTLFTVRALWVAVVAVAVCIGTYELVRALKVGGRQVPLLPLAAGAVAMPVAAYRAGTDGLFVALATTVLVAFAWRSVEATSTSRTDPTAAGRLAADYAAIVFTAGYVGFPAGFATLLTRPPDGPRRALAFLLVVVASDIGGYTAGVLSGGRHKLAPKVSPGKSWEGFAGSAVACVIVGVVMMAWPLHAAVWTGIVLGLACVAAATLGDLGESLLKRDIGIKDMGNLLPGHGGIMDRLDSLLCAAPVAWLLITAFAPIS